MKPLTWKKRMAILIANKRRLVKAFPEASLLEESGIYAFTRYEEETGLKYAYVGQAKKVLTRLAKHLMEHEQHIDNSIYKRKLFSEQNPEGWSVTAWYFPETYLDGKEREFIKKYADNGYQLYNKTAGGQEKGKIGIAPNAPVKGYRDGLKQGRENVRRECVALFSKHLRVEKTKETKLAERAMEKWQNFLSGEDNG